MAEPGQINDSLEQFVGQFTTPASREWAAGAAKRVQAHIVARNIAEHNAQLDQGFVQSIAGIKQNLAAVVSHEPTSLDMALDLVPHTINMLGDEHSLPQEHRDALISHMQTDIAHAAVTSLANQDYAGASRMLNGPRVSELLPQEQREQLGDYIATQENLRRTDQVAQMKQTLNTTLERDHKAGGGWLDQLVHPATGAPAFPPGWGQAVMADGNLTSETKAGLHRTYQAMIANGDTKSDPHLMADMIGEAAAGRVQPQDVLGMAGSNLSLQDASFLYKAARPPTSGDRSDLQVLSRSIEDARTIITHNSGPAGQQAFGRFMDWFMPTYQRLQGQGIEPGEILSPDTGVLSGETLQRFMPTHADVIRVSDNPFRPHLGEVYSSLGGSDAGRTVSAPTELAPYEPAAPAGTKDKMNTAAVPGSEEHQPNPMRVGDGLAGASPEHGGAFVMSPQNDVAINKGEQNEGEVSYGGKNLQAGKDI